MRKTLIFSLMQLMKIILIGYVTLIVLDVCTVLCNCRFQLIITVLDAEEQNVFSLLFNDTVYYITVKDIEPDTELLSKVFHVFIFQKN